MEVKRERESTQIGTHTKKGKGKGEDSRLGGKREGKEQRSRVEWKSGIIQMNQEMRYKSSNSYNWSLH